MRSFLKTSLAITLAAIWGCGESGDDTVGPARDGADAFTRDVEDQGDSSDIRQPDDVSEAQDVPATPDSGNNDSAPENDVADTSVDIGEPDSAATDVRDDDNADQTSCDYDDAHRYACCVFDAVNEYRAAAGLDPYIRDATLADVGFYYADYMASNNVYAHSADGMNFGERLDEFDVRWQSAGENLQRNNLADWRAACAETVNGRGGWAFSTAGHREAMLGEDASGTPKNWSNAGVGVARAGSNWYVAMYFVRY